MNGSCVHSYMLPNHRVVTDFQFGCLASILQVLGCFADRGEWKYLHPSAEASDSCKMNVCANASPVSDNHGATDNGVRADAYSLANLSTSADHRRRVNARKSGVPIHSSDAISFTANIAANSQSATNVSPTFALPSNRQILSLAFSFRTCNSNTSPGTTGLRKRAFSIDMK